MFASFLFAVTVARTAVFALPVGLFFAAAATPSDARASLTTASALTIGSGLGLWPSGRLLDRIGRWRGLRLAMVAGAASLVLLAFGVNRAWPLPGIVMVAATSGAVWSPVIAIPRALLPDVAPESRSSWASGIEAASTEVALILAPVAGAWLGRSGPAAVPAAAGGVLAVGALVLRVHPDGARRLASSPALISRPVLGLAGLALLSGLSGGVLEPGLATLPSSPPHLPGGNAVLFVAIGLGSVSGGLLAAHHTWPHRAEHGVPLFLLHGIGLAAVSVTDGPVQLVLLVITGLPIAPLTSLAGLHLDRWVGTSRAGETFGLVMTALTLGTGLGQAFAARAIEQLAPHQLVLLAALPPVLAALTLDLRRRRSRS